MKTAKILDLHVRINATLSRWLIQKAEDRGITPQKMIVILIDRAKETEERGKRRDKCSER